MRRSFLLTTLFCSLFLLVGQAQSDKEEYGKASFYSDEFNGRSTAYGDTYDKNALTCAHKRHPYGSILLVTRLDNKRTVRVKVTDKGPFIKGRVVDLSRRAAEELGMLADGLDEAEVRVTLASAGSSSTVSLGEPEEQAVAVEERPISYDQVPAPQIEEAPVVTPAPQREEPAPVQQAETPKPVAATPAPQPKQTQPTTVPANDRFRKVGEDYSPYGLYRIVLEKPTAAKYGVQVASLSNYQNVLKQVADLQAKWFDNILISIEPGANNVTNYKVILGPFDDEEGAQHYQQSMRSRYNIRGFVVDLEGIEY